MTLNLRTARTVQRRARWFELALSPLFLPVMFAAWPVSLLCTWQRNLRVRRDERLLAEQMEAAGRIISARRLLERDSDTVGTLLLEFVTSTGPVRIWWSPEDVPDPYTAAEGGSAEAMINVVYGRFRRAYFGVHGSALLVAGSLAERQVLLRGADMASVRFNILSVGFSVELLERLYGLDKTCGAEARD